MKPMVLLIGGDALTLLDVSIKCAVEISPYLASQKQIMRAAHEMEAWTASLVGWIFIIVGSSINESK